MVGVKLVQPPADQSAMHAPAVSHLQCGADLVQRQLGRRSKPMPQPIGKTGRLATHAAARVQAPVLPLQLDHVVPDLRRHPEGPARLSMPVPRCDKPNSPAAKFNRMRLPHVCPSIWSSRVNNKSPDMAILKLTRDGTLQGFHSDPNIPAGGSCR